jgi:hypothetical protein
VVVVDPTRITVEHWGRLDDGELFARARYVAWAVLRKRSFGFAVLKCPSCGRKRVVLATITEPAVVRKILEHLGVRASEPGEPPAIPPAPVAEPVDVDVDGDVDADVAAAEAPPAPPRLRRGTTTCREQRRRSAENKQGCRVTHRGPPGTRYRAFAGERGYRCRQIRGA